MLKITKRIKDAMRKFLGRKKRVNAKIKSSYPDFRIIVDKSNKYMKAQVIDLTGKVICHISDKEIKGTTKTDRAQKAGEALAALMKKAGIEKAAFDRNGNLYHGRVKALVDGIRTGGIAI
ncbi:MAG: 50S ribosomal protein L18 [candidate division SR1 bacterium]|nr:50S ribosomal protein L18 [candidate division SR1 bacterium]